MCWRETPGFREAKERGVADVEKEVSEVGRGVVIRATTISRITSVVAGAGGVTGTRRLSTVWGVECELLSDGGVLRLSSTWNGAGTGKEGASRLVREGGDSAA